MKDAERRAALRQLWLQRPEHKRKGNDVLVFSGWLEQHRPELLGRNRGDSSRQLTAALGDLWRGTVVDFAPRSGPVRRRGDAVSPRMAGRCR